MVRGPRMSVAIGISPEKPIDLSAPLSERTNPKVPTMAARADLFPPAHPRRRPAKSSRQKSAAPKSSIDDTISREDQHGVEELFNGFRAGIAELLGGIDAAVKQLRTAALQQKQRCEEVRSSVSDIAGVIGQTNRNISETAMAAADLSASLGRNGSARTPRPASWVWVGDTHMLSDGARTLEVHHVPNGHAANLLMGYLPHEKLLIITDIFNDFGEPRPNDPPPGVVSPYYAALGDRLRQLTLDVQRIAPSHGKGTVPADMLWKALQGKVQAPQVVGSRQ